MENKEYNHNLKELSEYTGVSEKNMIEHFVNKDLISCIHINEVYFTNEDGLDYILNHVTLSGDIIQ